MTQQNFKIERQQQQFTILKEIDDGLPYELYWGTEPTLSKKNKNYFDTFDTTTYSFNDPDPTKRIYFYLFSPNSHFLIGERKVMVPHLYNLRDLGGYPTIDGNLTRFGLLFRSDDLFPLEDVDITYLEQMNITSIIDYRSEAERNTRPNKPLVTATQYVCSPNARMAELASASMETDKERIDKLLQVANGPNAEAYFEKGRRGMEQEMSRFVEEPIGIEAFKKLLSIVKKTSNAPLIQHCRGGKDRTGYGSALILLILGIPEQTIMADYLLTIKMNKERNENRMNEYRQYTEHPLVLKALSDAMSTQESYLKASFSTMSKLASTPLDYIKTYLDVNDQDIAMMKAAYSYSPTL